MTGAAFTGAAAALAAAAFANSAFANSALASAAFLAAFFAATAFIAARFCAEFSAAAFAAAAFAAAAALPLAFSGALAAVLTGDLEGFLEAVLEVAALGATFAVLFGISLLFLEAAAGVPLRPGALTGNRARPVEAAWRAEAACFATLRALSVEILLEAAFTEFFLPEADLPEDLDELLLRVFCGTTIAQNRRAPVD